MSLPKWVAREVKRKGERLIYQANSIRQRYASQESARNVMFGVADKWEKEGKELINVAAEGNEDNVERAYHSIVYGPPGTVTAIPLDWICEYTEIR
jgi:hypothetical protein